MTPTLQTPAELERRQTVRDQLRMIRRAHGRHVAWDSRDPADYRLLYDDRHVLVSADDVDRVQGAFADPGNQEQFFEGEGTVLNADDDVRGATISEIVRIVPPVSRRRRGPDVLEATRVVNRFLDEPGVVSPDHILHVTAGGDGRTCPATEPEETGLNGHGRGERTRRSRQGSPHGCGRHRRLPARWPTPTPSGWPVACPESPGRSVRPTGSTPDTEGSIAGVLRCRARKRAGSIFGYGAQAVPRSWSGRRVEVPRARNVLRSSTCRPAATPTTTRVWRPSGSCGGRPATQGRPTPCWWPRPATTAAARLLPGGVRLGRWASAR